MDRDTDLKRTESDACLRLCRYMLYEAIEPDLAGGECHSMAKATGDSVDRARRRFVLKALRAGAVLTVADNAHSHNQTSHAATGADTDVDYASVAGELGNIHVSNGFDKRKLNERLLDQGIWVSSRDELMAAQDYVKTVLGERTTIHLSRDFSPWTAAQTSIDLAYVTLAGHADGAHIDARGIPNVEGNYFLRLYNSGDKTVNSLSYLGGDRLSGINVIGPGRHSHVTAFLFNSPEGSLGVFSTRSRQLQEFGYGDVYQQNAYIVHNYNCSITRCAVHIDMPSGFANYGEGIEYYGGAVATSSGLAIHNDNNNGAIRLFGTSVDYVGQLVHAQSGSVELYGCHQEFNNDSNPLTAIPYICGSHETSRIVIVGGEILGWNSDLDVPALFDVSADAMGVFLRDVKLLKLLTTTGRFKQGDGAIYIDNPGVIDGTGNYLVSTLLSARENLVLDGGNQGNAPAEWLIANDTAAITDRLTGDNLALSNSTDVACSGSKAFKAAKVKYGRGSNAAIMLLVPVKKAGTLNNSSYLYRFAVGMTGTAYAEQAYVGVSHFSQYGLPVIAKTERICSGVALAAVTTRWVRHHQQLVRKPAPDWATHVAFIINMFDVSVGALYIDDVEIYQF